MTFDPHHLALGDSARLKLRASALVAEGGPLVSYEVALLFHEAARAEARALAALASPSAETRLRSAIERCGCLVEGRDPTGVLEVAWPEVMAISDEVPGALARRLRVRIDPMIEAFLREAGEAVQAAPDFFARMESPIAPRLRSTGTLSAKAGRQLDHLLRVFPGDARLWMMQAFRVSLEDPRAVEHARRARALLLDEATAGGIESLAPAIEVLAAAFTSPLAEAEAAFDAGYARVRSSTPGPDYCLALVTAGLVIVQRRGAGSRHLWERVAEVAARGEALPDRRVPSYAPLFRASRMIAVESLAKRKPSLDILYRVGLGAAASRARSEDPVAILREEMTGRMVGVAA